jgi:hypothetical protein
MVLLLGLACSGESAGEFSPLIRKGGAGSYDLALEGIPSIRAAELAPGAAPAVPKIEADRAEKTIHFLATYARVVDPVEIGGQTIASLQAATFLQVKSVDRRPSERGFLAEIVYTTDAADGTVRLELARTEQPNRLELTYRVEETLR